MKRCSRSQFWAAIAALVLATLTIFWWRRSGAVHIQIRLASDGPVIVARTLSAKEASQILERIRQKRRRSDLSALWRFGIRGAPSVICRHLFERVREMEIERDGSVTVLARSRPERPPTETYPNPGYSGYGRSYRMEKGTNGWQVTGSGSFTVGSRLVTYSYGGQ